MLEIRSPIDGARVGSVPELSHGQVDALLATLRAHQPAWAARPLGERSELLHRAADLLVERVDTLAELLVLEVAKARKDARDEVLRSAEFIHHTAEEARRLIGDSQFSDAFGGQARTKLAVDYRVPLGIVLAIPPFNYPVNLAVSKLAPALAAGNAVVLKPPTQGTLAGCATVRAFHEAGIPEGVLACATGRGSRIGDHLVEHPAVDMISFTGSSETGQALARRAGMVPLMLELGGKDPAIVLGDADLELAASDIVAGAFSYAGQRCTAVKRVLVTEGVADELVERLAARVATLTVGDPREDAQITPLVDPEAAERAERMIEQAVAAGATVVHGGGRTDNLLEPTLLDGVTPEMDVAWVEPFAPVLPVLRVRSAAEAAELANRSEYGLQAAVFSRDVTTAVQLSLLLDTGTVQINGRTARGPDHFLFVGAKASGLGAQGIRHSLEAMTRRKSVVFNLRPAELELVA